MSLDEMRYVVARLLTEPDFQDEFFEASPDRHDEFGLERDEFETLQEVDARSLGISSEGYLGKRFERVISFAPRTLGALREADPEFALDYLESTAFPRNDAEERETFQQYTRGRDDLPPETERYVEDLLALETALYERGPPEEVPSYRFQPATTRPRAADPLVVSTDGPLPDVWDAGDGPPVSVDDYPEDPRDVLVLRDGDSIDLWNLTDDRRRLLEDCDGERTVGDLLEEHGPEAEDVLRRWLRLGIVEDAASAPA